MTTPVRNILLVGVVQIAIVAGVAGKYLLDRRTLPRVWVRTAPVDPNLPIRGRYVSLRLEVETRDVQPPARPEPLGTGRGGREWTPPTRPVPISLEVRDGQLVAVPAGDRVVWLSAIDRDGQRVGVLERPVAFFIAEHVPDPSLRQSGEELWAEVSLPPRGTPRPIRLAVKKDGVLTPLDLR